MKVIGVIPARFASTRFPGKPLVMIDGITMIQRVYMQAIKAKSLDKVIVATDDPRIIDNINEIGGFAVMTSSNHQSGTDRCFEAVSIIEQQNISENYDIIINIQGDEPLINPIQIDTLSKCFINTEIQIATLIKIIKNNDELNNPNVVKVVIDSNNNAMYFSRSPIPFLRGIDIQEWSGKHTFYKHIGIYAFRKNILKTVTNLKQSSLEKAESLEQLRWLENGLSVKVQLTEFDNFAIDTPNDLLTIYQHLTKD